jgi:TM2 domain-containing membrane protein YozV
MSRDLRQYARQTNSRLIVGFILLLFIVGDGLIYLFYGRGAAIMGLICLLGGIAPIVLILTALWIIDWVGKQNNQE